VLKEGGFDPSQGGIEAGLSPPFPRGEDHELMGRMLMQRYK